MCLFQCQLWMAKNLEEVGIHSFQELTAYVPNLSITENAVNTIIGMRGVGIGANQSFEQSVGIYVDGVHYGKSRQVRTGLFDLQQVEVLRGPQGILFGKNTPCWRNQHHICFTTGWPGDGRQNRGKRRVIWWSNH